jgi:predicted anti-sigma-YlaC factor YlaD
MHYHALDVGKFDCRKFKARLDVALDERRRPEQDAQLRSHARHCADCAAWMKSQTTALAALESMAVEECPADFAFRVLQSVEPLRRPPRWRRWAVAALAVAAGLLLAVLGWRSPEVAPNRPETPIAKQSPAVPSPAVPSYEILARKTEDFAVNLKSHQLVVVGEVAEGFKPVTSSVFTALNSRWRALPGSESAARTL